MFGLDSQLLETRRLVFQCAGFDAIAVSSLEQLQTIVAPIRVIVLCHTLTLEDCEQASRSAALRWPGVEEVVLTRLGGTSDCATHHPDNFSVDDGPAKLVGRIQKLIPKPQSLEVGAAHGR